MTINSPLGSGERPMNLEFPSTNMLVFIVFALLIFQGCTRNMEAGSSGSFALSGTVTSSAEGKMEGVLVSAKREGSTITTTVVTRKDGMYSFPQNRLAPGKYHLKIRAVGYD